MAGVAALVDLLVNRVLVKLGDDAWSRDMLIELGRWGGFARNLSVISALVALAFCLVALSSRKSGLPLSARAAIFSSGWMLIPIVASMTLLPRALTPVERVLVVAGVAHALTFLLILAGIHWRPTRATSAGLLLMLVASLSGVASTIVTLVGNRTYWEQTERLSNAFRWSGELAYLSVPLALGFGVAISWSQTRGRAALALSALAAAAFAAGMVVWKQAVGPDLPTLLYGALRLDLLPDRYVVLYAIPLGIGWAVTVASTLSKDRARRQIGAALLVLLSSGYAPQTPSTLVTMVLGVALLSRTGIAMAHRHPVAFVAGR
jgi:hypothetical protein